MGLNLSCGCWQKQKEPERQQQQQQEKEPEPIDYQKMTNKQTSFLHAQFMLTNPYNNYVTQEFVMSGPPDDMHREFLKLEEDAPKYIEKKYINHTLYKVNFINLYTSPDAIINHSDPPAVAPAIIPVVAPAVVPVVAPVVAPAVVPVPPANPVSV